MLPVQCFYKKQNVKECHEQAERQTEKENSKCASCLKSYYSNKNNLQNHKIRDYEHFYHLPDNERLN